MYWANFLHIYQPHDQRLDVLDEIITQSYRPLLEGIRSRPHVRLTLNINGALMELFDKHGHHDLIDILREVSKDGRVEFTSTAKYHAFLPFLDPEEMVRQIKINNETNSFFLGEGWKPRGFFPPEMAFDERIVPIIDDLGFSWIILDEIAHDGVPGNAHFDVLHKIPKSNLRVFFRERRLSNLIMGAIVRSPESLREAMKDDLQKNRYVITAMDGETFGHHRPGLEKTLFEIFDTKDFNMVRISDIPDHFKKEVEIMPVKSTWASSAADIEKGIQFLTWADPSNKIHTWQKEFTDLVLQEVKKVSPDDPAYKDIRHRMDVALASDQFFWASAKPWWSVEQIEGGAYYLLETARMIPGISPEVLKKARSLYEDIVSTGFQWQRSGKIRAMYEEQYSVHRIPFKERTLEKGGEIATEFAAFTDMMKDLEKKASASGEYEKAILWRDAVYKLEHKTEIYDAINAIDLLRVHIPNDIVEKTLAKYKEDYRKIRGGQPEQRGN